MVETIDTLDYPLPSTDTTLTTENDVFQEGAIQIQKAQEIKETANEIWPLVIIVALSVLIITMIVSIICLRNKFKMEKLGQMKQQISH